jgi:hypothetical protein
LGGIVRAVSDGNSDLGIPTIGDGTISLYLTAFAKYAGNYTNYSFFINTYISGGFIAECIYGLLTYIVVMFRDYFVVVAVIFFVPLAMEGIFQLRGGSIVLRKKGHIKKNSANVEDKVADEADGAKKATDSMSHHKVYHVGTMKINLNKEADAIAAVPIAQAAPAPLTINDLLQVNAGTKKLDIKKIDQETISATKKILTSDLKVSAPYTASVPDEKIKDETTDGYDVNHKFALDIIAKINDVIKAHELNIKFVTLTTMPLYSLFKYQGSDESEIEKLLEYKREFSKAIDLEKFAISLKGKVATFELKNPKPFKIALRSVNNTEVMLLGIDTERKPIALDNSDVSNLAIFGKQGSGASMLLSNVITAYVKTIDLKNNHIYILACDDAPRTVSNIYSDLIYLKDHIYRGSKNSIQQLEKMIEEDITKQHFIIIEDFNKIIEKDLVNRDKIIALSVKVAKAGGKLFLTSKVASNIVANPELLSKLDAFVVFAVETDAESERLIESSQASTLHGNGDGYLLVKSNGKIRFQACYTGAHELKQIIMALNEKYK